MEAQFITKTTKSIKLSTFCHLFMSYSINKLIFRFNKENILLAPENSGGGWGGMGWEGGGRGAGTLNYLAKLAKVSFYS